MEKEIDINNEEEILKKCDFNYLYYSEKCSRELCMFYNDIIRTANNLQEKFDAHQAFIDLGRIAITLNQQDARIKELEKALKKANTNNYLTDYYLVEKENQRLKEEIIRVKNNGVGAIQNVLYALDVFKINTMNSNNHKTKRRLKCWRK